MKLKVILTGATGMVGEGVLHECLKSDDVEEILIVGRKPYGITHPKVKEIVHKDFFDLSPIADQLKGYNICFFCAGISSVGKNEESFYKYTYTLTLNFAKTVCRNNPDMIFCYISGRGTDSSEKGKAMWARVKGKTENDLMKLPFKRVYNFRPGIMTPTKGLKNTLKLYKYMSWLIPVIKLFSSNWVSSLKQLGIAMIKVASQGYEKQIIEVKDILVLSK